MMSASDDKEALMMLNGAAAAVWIELKTFRRIVDEVTINENCQFRINVLHRETRAYDTSGMLRTGWTDFGAILHDVALTTGALNTPSAVERTLVH